MRNFITFEGGEGSGKSTLIGTLSEYCKNNNIECVVTREPGGLDFCEKIRGILKSTQEISTKTQFLLFSASRSHLCENLIKPSLKQGKIVFCDRFFDSSRIYQGYCDGLGDQTVMNITNIAVEDVVPQITFYLDIDPVKAFERKGGADKGDVFEEKGLEFHKKVREGYLKLASLEPNRFVVIDASMPKEKVFDAVLKHLKAKNVL